MHKPVISLAAPAATIATIVFLPHGIFAPMTLLAVVVAAVMSSWAVLYLWLQSRKRSHVQS